MYEPNLVEFLFGFKIWAGPIDLKGRMRHMLQHHGTDHAYVCECLQTFKLMKELRDHKLEMHGEQSKDKKLRFDEYDQLKVTTTEWSSEDEEMNVQ